MTHVRTIAIALSVCALIMSVACVDEAFMKESAAKFADQHFKTAIGLIELHKIRTGEYPARLEDAQFAGDWDKLGFENVKYERLAEGYSLDVIGPDDTSARLSYPDEFWKGLGLVRSNVKRDTASQPAAGVRPRS
jgi:hypothetical protein